MPQLSLYLDESTMERLRERAASEHVSLSKFAAHCIAEDDCHSAWPAGFWELYGSIDDDSFACPDELDPALDAPRGQL